MTWCSIGRHDWTKWELVSYKNPVSVGTISTDRLKWVNQRKCVRCRKLNWKDPYK